MYDVIILGGGPAGVAAGVYSARKKLKTLLITKEFGGQSIVSDDIENWIGEKHISGFDLAQKLENHVRAYEDDSIDIKMESVEKVDKIESEERDHDFEIKTDKGTYKGKTVILTLGARRRRLGVPGEDKFEGKGVVYCATCDAPLFADKDVAVIGGGNAGVEAAIDLLAYANKIYLLQRSDKLKADPVSVVRVKSEDKINIIYNADTKEVLGDAMVESLIYEDGNGESKKLDVGGVFVEIGSVPNSNPVEDLVDIDNYGQVKIDSKHASTSLTGVFAAGDITDDPYKQNNISAGDAVKAALAAYAYLQKIDKKSPAKE
ncbi:MAG: FAD-dependent oxidoreductase [Candidatus Paceibacterota bacterium]